MSDNVKILYRSDSIVCCIKEPGVLSEDPGLPGLIKSSLGVSEAFCIHRLDRGTGGVMVYALNRDSAAGLSQAFSAGGSARKTYLTVISGVMEEKNGTLDDLLFHDSRKNKTFVVSRTRRGVREARLFYETICEKDGMSLVRVRLHSGRTHQIRVQFSSRKHPVLGDRRYGSSVNCPLALWAYSLDFSEPATGEPVSVSAPPPDNYPWSVFSGDLLHLDPAES